MVAATLGLPLCLPVVDAVAGASVPLLEHR